MIASRRRRWRVQVIMESDEDGAGAAIMYVSPWGFKKEYFARIALDRSKVEDKDTPFDTKLAERLADAKSALVPVNTTRLHK